MVVRVGAGLAVLALLAGLVLTFLPHSSRSAGTPAPVQATTSTAAPAPTVADAEFLRTVESIRALITASAGDRCKLVDAFTAFGKLPRPVNTEQARNGVMVTAELLNSAADGMEADEATSAQALKDAASGLLAEADQQGYDPAWLTKSPGAAALNAPAFRTAIGAYQSRTVELCPAAGSGSTAGPSPSGAPQGPTTATTTTATTTAE